MIIKFLQDVGIYKEAQNQKHFDITGLVCKLHFCKFHFSHKHRMITRTTNKFARDWIEIGKFHNSKG